VSRRLVLVPMVMTLALAGGCRASDDAAQVDNAAPTPQLAATVAPDNAVPAPPPQPQPQPQATPCALSQTA